MSGEKIALALVFASLALIVIFQVRPALIAASGGDALESQTIADTKSGPAYMIAQAPWMFGPPIGNILPTIAKASEHS